MDAHSRNRREDEGEEPLRGLVRGLPGTGKSRVIQWVIRMFQEVMNLEHGREYLCVAFQNKVAHAMGGHTLHTAGEVRIGQQNYDALLECKDIDGLYTRIEALRWMLFDEAFMNQMNSWVALQKTYSKLPRETTDITNARIRSFVCSAD